MPELIFVILTKEGSHKKLDNNLRLCLRSLFVILTQEAHKQAAKDIVQTLNSVLLYPSKLKFSISIQFLLLKFYILHVKISLWFKIVTEIRFCVL